MSSHTCIISQLGFYSLQGYIELYIEVIYRVVYIESVCASWGVADHENERS